MSPVVPSIGTKLGSGWSSLLKRSPLDGASFADVLREQVRFRVIRSGATSVTDVVPDSAAARALWELPSTKRFAQGVLDLANEVSGTDATPLRGFTLATSEAGYVANRAVHHFRAGVAPSREAYEAGISAARAHTKGTAAIRKGAWLHLGPGRSEGMLHVLEHPGTSREGLTPRLRTSLGRGTKTLLHELNHIGSGAPSAWVSEGKAEALARWPGRVLHAGRRLGLAVPNGVGRWADAAGPYQEEVAAIRALLRASGIDTRRASAFPAAEQLLNATPPHRLSNAIADAIVTRHATTTAEGARLHRTVIELIEERIAPDGTNADPRAVRRLARELERARRDRLAPAP